jgi:hypothetical protein
MLVSTSIAKVATLKDVELAAPALLQLVKFRMVSSAIWEVAVSCKITDTNLGLSSGFMDCESPHWIIPSLKRVNLIILFLSFLILKSLLVILILILIDVWVVLRHQEGILDDFRGHNLFCLDAFILGHFL